jgi:probable addiction module antidote protein
MEKPAVEYKEELLRKLKSLRYSAKYLSAALRDSTETFLVALRNVVEAKAGMKKLAADAGVNRENLYRMLSEEGNPRLQNLDAILKTLGLQLIVVEKNQTAIAVSISSEAAPLTNQAEQQLGRRFNPFRPRQSSTLNDVLAGQYQGTTSVPPPVSAYANH